LADTIAAVLETGRECPPQTAIRSIYLVVIATVRFAVRPHIPAIMVVNETNPGLTAVPVPRRSQDHR